MLISVLPCVECLSILLEDTCYYNIYDMAIDFLQLIQTTVQHLGTFKKELYART